MKYIGILIATCILLTSCATKKQISPINSGKNSMNRTLPRGINGAATSTTALRYIERYKAIAIAEMNIYGIPASITLAQGLLESASGNSMLATQANNHFGIKCTSSWKGKTILKDDDKSDECFRAYKTAEESFRDHSEFLKRPRYAFLFELDKNDYKGWARGLKTAGYATNPNYPELLIRLIERYNLQHHDRSELHKIQQDNQVLSEIAEQPTETKNAVAVKAPVAMTIYEVKQGDTLYSISKRFNVDVDDLKALNNLVDDSIKLGQLLLVSK